MTQQEASALIKACTFLWPYSPLQAQYGREMIRLWQLALADITAAEAEYQVVLASRHGDEFPPAPGEVARLALDARARTNGTAAPDVDVAWRSVIELVRSRGWYAGPPDTYGHPAVEAAARALGWNRLCQGDEMVTMAHFKTLYQAASRREEQVRQEGETVTMLTAMVAAGELPAGPPGELPTA